MNSLILYAEVNVLCAIILMIIISTPIRVENIYRLRTTTAIYLIHIISDIVWATIGQKSIALNKITCTIYFMALAISGYSLFWYSEREQGKELNKIYISIMSIPLAIILIGDIYNLWNPWLFYITENNEYVLADLSVLQYVVTYGYLIVSSAGCSYIISQDNTKRQKYTLLAIYPLIPTAFTLIEYMFPGLPLTCIGNTIALLLLYIHSLKELISTDPLTKINNRQGLIGYLSYHMKINQDKLWLMMIDADKFKSINDTYGHIEGDEALKIIANSMKKACIGVDCDRPFIARYAGDEFSIAFCGTERDAKEIKERLNTELEKVTDKQYKVSVSVGYTQYQVGQTIEQFIDSADQNLYAEKINKKLKR